MPNPCCAQSLYSELKKLKEQEDRLIEKFKRGELCACGKVVEYERETNPRTDPLDVDHRGGVRGVIFFVGCSNASEPHSVSATYPDGPGRVV